MPNSLLITQCNIIADPFFLRENCYVSIENGTITEVGGMNELGERSAGTTFDATGKLVIPGLINGHCHSPMALFRGMADDLDLHTWLHEHMFPAEAARINEETVYWSSKLAAAEMLLSGTTCVADAYFHPDQTARAFEETGLRAIVAHGVLDLPAPGVPDPARNIEAVAGFLHRWKDRCSRITPAVFAHSPYTCSPATLQKAKRLADDNNVPFFIHLAESAGEQEVILAPKGDTPLRHLHALGILDANCILVHAIWLDDTDLDILAGSKAGVIVCPQSNYKLAAGQSRVADMVSRGIAVGLGTDGPASNNSLDMFREMDLFAKSHKVRHGDPTIFPAEQVFHMATRNTNSICRLATDNAIRPGSRADLAIIDLHSPHLTPLYNQDLVVYCVRGYDVASVIVDGQLLVKDRELLSTDVKQLQETIRHLVEHDKSSRRRTTS